jgi:hypothetical protein
MCLEATGLDSMGLQGPPGRICRLSDEVQTKYSTGQEPGESFSKLNDKAFQRVISYRVCGRQGKKPFLPALSVLLLHGKRWAITSLPGQVSPDTPRAPEDGTQMAPTNRPKPDPSP